MLGRKGGVGSTGASATDADEHSEVHGVAERPPVDEQEQLLRAPTEGLRPTVVASSVKDAAGSRTVNGYLVPTSTEEDEQSAEGMKVNEPIDLTDNTSEPS